MRLRGNSMPLDLEESDLLIVNPEKAFTNVNGGIVVIKHSGVFNIRHIFLLGDNHLLEPANKSYAPEIVPVA